MREGGLHTFGQYAEALRNTEQCLQRIDLAVLAGGKPRHQRPRIEPGFPDRVQADVTATIVQRLQHLAAWLVRHDIGHLGRTRGNDTAVAAKQGEFRSPAAHTDIVDVERQRGRRRIGHLLRHALGQAQHVAQAHIKRRTTQIQGVLQRLLDADIEPGIDTALQKLQGEVIHHRHRHDRHQHEHEHQPCRQLGTDGLLALLAEQPDDVGHHQRTQHHESGRIGQQHPGINFAEALGVVRGIAHQGERHQQQRKQHQHRQHANAETVHRANRH